MDQQRLVSVFGWACLSLLGACGGGGGEVSPSVVVPLAGSSPAPSTPPAAGTSLVPEAGPVGAILYADAALLRVMRPGATWTYRGTVQPQGAAGIDNIGYTNKVGLTGPDGQSYAQQHTNEFNLGPSVHSDLRFEGGVWTTGASVEFSGSGVRVSERVAELRSPVRLNDLYGIVERSDVDTGSDYDGDRVNDKASVAMYSRVVARESVDLPNRRGVEAVRVDLTLRVRVTASATRTFLPVYESVRSYWYAPGIGVVRQRLEEPNNTAGLPKRVVTEELENWDGLTEGVGHLPVQVTDVLRNPFDAVAFDSHAVVAAQLADGMSPFGIVLAQIDRRGAVLAQRRYALSELFPGAPSILEQRLLRSGDELRLFARTGSGTIGMLSFDVTGQRILRPPVTVMTDPALMWDYDGSSYRVAADGAGFWLAWLRTSRTTDGQDRSSALVARFDASGQARGAPQLVMQPAAVGVHSFSLAADGNRVGLSWYEGYPLAARSLVTLDATSMTVASRTPGIPPAACNEARVLALQPGLAMTCWGNSLTPVGAARIDANGQLVLADAAASGAGLAGEGFKAPWLTYVNGHALATGGAGELYVATSQAAPYWPGENAHSFTTVLRTNSAGGALAAREPVLLARLRDWSVNVFSTLVFEHHLLLLGRDSQGNLNTSVVWLPK